jgi:hypothetical protein
MEGEFSEVNTASISDVRDAVAGIHRRLFPGGDFAFVPEAFKRMEEAFSGHYANYQAVDTKYHDLEHTLQGTLCFARILEGYKKAGAKPELTEKAFELGLLAILLHDTGYLKKRNDSEGTGAKYTLVHVNRSAEFAATLLRAEGLPLEDLHSVQNMIRCTGVNTDLKSIPFQSDLERNVGFALGTADLLGQMAAPDYVEKLGILYQEFEESNKHSGKTSGPGVFTSVNDLRQKTPGFWENYVLPKINNDFLGLYKFLAVPYPNGHNIYLERVRANIDSLKEQLKTAPAA